MQLNYTAENLFPSLKSPVKVITIDLMPSFAYCVFTSQDCTTAQDPTQQQLVGEIRRDLSQAETQSAPFPTLMSMYTQEKKHSYESQKYQKDLEKKQQVSSFLKYLSTVSAVLKMDSPDALFTVLLGMPWSQRKHIVGKRTAAAEFVSWRHRAEQGSRGFRWHHSSAGTAEAFGGNRIIIPGRNPILMKQDISQRHKEA